MHVPTETAPLHADRVAVYRTRVTEGLHALAFPAVPEGLYEPVRYVLSGTGKRIRPVLLMLAAEAYDVDSDRALWAALAVEVFHSFTLVHDDIMDHALERRGRPAVHVRWDESTALLCGDFLMGLAYDLLARVDHPNLALMLRSFQRMVARLCEGQLLDKSFEERAVVSVEEYLSMIERKTGALLETALELGGFLGDASDDERRRLCDVGRNVGRAFQIQDDLLDLTATDAGWGKTIGGDLLEGKKTFLLLRALEQSRGEDRIWFERIVDDGGLSREKIDEARERMHRLGVLDEAAWSVAKYYDAARVALVRLPAAPALQTLAWMIERMTARRH